MEITTVKIINDIDGTHDSYLLNSELYVPLDSANRHYQAIQDWIAEGNTPTPADT